MMKLLLSALWGYCVGAIPTGVIVTQVLTGKDVRSLGSRHTGGTNVARVAGKYAGLLTAVIDLVLGLVAVLVAWLVTHDTWAAMSAGVAAVVGHDWSIFIRFGGGIGLAKLSGGLVALGGWQPWVAATVLMALWLVLIRRLHMHRARSTILVMLLVGPLLWGLGIALPGVLQGTLGACVVIAKTIPDWHRQY